MLYLHSITFTHIPFPFPHPQGLNGFAVGCDEGSVVVKMGSDDPMASMDATTGKIVWAKHTEVQSASIKSMGEYQVQDGERLPLAVKDMGTADVFPTFLKHSPNGRFIAVVSDDGRGS